MQMYAETRNTKRKQRGRPSSRIENTTKIDLI
jgi:hypothetical protein